jgi:hypothetical protein
VIQTVLQSRDNKRLPKAADLKGLKPFPHVEKVEKEGLSPCPPQISLIIYQTLIIPHYVA